MQAPSQQGAAEAADVSLYAADKVAHNDKIVYQSKLFVSVMFGIMTGVLGLTGLYGFLVYIIAMIFTTIILTSTLPSVSCKAIYIIV